VFLPDFCHNFIYYFLLPFAYCFLSCLLALHLVLHLKRFLYIKNSPKIQTNLRLTPNNDHSFIAGPIFNFQHKTTSEQRPPVNNSHKLWVPRVVVVQGLTVLFYHCRETRTVSYKTDYEKVIEVMKFL
jgi:hypothetical protein